jgi:hypothetical protein
VDSKYEGVSDSVVKAEENKHYSSFKCMRNYNSFSNNYSYNSVEGIIGK